MPSFCKREITSWQQFNKYVLNELAPHGWTYRGQSKDWPLSTTIERALLGWDIDQKEAPRIEFQTMREFRRRIRDPLYERVHSDTLFCLALMQHHGAPTRLLDCTYSPYVAAAFAIQDGFSGTCPVIWCFRAEWCEEVARKATEPANLVDLRNDDEKRTDRTFVPLYQIGSPAGSGKRWKFVNQENPLQLHERLTTQQGTFLCPADLEVSFSDNLTAMPGSISKSNVIKLVLKLDKRAATEFVQCLKSMNLSFAALFPGLDGFARSIGQQIFHYRELANTGAGFGTKL